MRVISAPLMANGSSHNESTFIYIYVVVVLCNLWSNITIHILPGKRTCVNYTKTALFFYMQNFLSKNHQRAKEQTNKIIVKICCGGVLV
jgi:hypothetical protein